MTDSSISLIINGIEYTTIEEAADLLFLSTEQLQRVVQARIAQGLTLEFTYDPGFYEEPTWDKETI